jgi:methionine sulfoxide reductase catalytic subunit
MQMWIHKSRRWNLPDREATPESVYLNRRALLAGMGLGAGAILAPPLAGTANAKWSPESDPSLGLYPVAGNPAYASVDRPLTPEKMARTYNNFYEFGSHKNIWPTAEDKLQIRPWTVTIDGLVEKPLTLDIDDLLKQVALEERVYRHRCVETWAMRVPWTGFPLRALVDLAKPLGSAKYLRMVTFEDSAMAVGQKQFWYPWPYVEGLTMAEATHDLAFLVTGLYGKPLPPQNGSPLRLATPWKYGFKSIKSIVRFEFVEKRPVSFWEEIQSSEYGFWANVNPEVPHPRWSQARERDLETGETYPTQLYNGYATEIADLYAGMKGERLFL